MQTGPQVLATGGGAYMDEGTRAKIKASGVSVWLKAELPVLLHRVRRRGDRPLLQGTDPEKVMRELMAKRYPIYAEADITVESRDVPHEMMVSDVGRTTSGSSSSFPPPWVTTAVSGAKPSTCSASRARKLCGMNNGK